MYIQDFNLYQYMSELEMVEPILCINDPEHGRLYANLGENDKVFLFCLACEMVVHPGMSLEEKVSYAINKFGKLINEPESE